MGFKTLRPNSKSVNAYKYSLSNNLHQESDCDRQFPVRHIPDEFSGRRCTRI